MKRVSERVVQLNTAETNKRPRYVLYWMQMYKRASFNHALTYAILKANELKLPLVVYEELNSREPWASDRFHTFVLEGVEEKKRDLDHLGIRYIFDLQKEGDAFAQIADRLAHDAACIVTDDFPCLTIPEQNRRMADRVDVPFYAVDSNGIIPLSKFDKEEYAAYTLRPKIRKLLPTYLKPFTEVSLDMDGTGLEVDCPETTITHAKIAELVDECDIDHSVTPSPVYHGGTANGRKRLKKFIDEILRNYDSTRSRPEIDGTSRLSPYLHFGFLSPIEIALEVRNSRAPESAKEAFLEELIVRRELSFNFTYNNPNYDSLDSLPAWLQKTMRKHIADERPIVYSIEQLEAGETHDELWNAAQHEMVVTGEMHNYVRMLWGKNVIAWTRSYEEAFAVLEHLNNKYCLDGRDPNSYAGILWCFGKHDRPWMERPIFGTMRYMTSGSTGRKFDSGKYIEWTRGLK